MDMDVTDFYKWNRISDIARARDEYESLGISSFANLTKEAKSKYLKNLEKRAYPDEISEKKVYSNDDAFRLFKRMSQNAR